MGIHKSRMLLNATVSQVPVGLPISRADRQTWTNCSYEQNTQQFEDIESVQVAHRDNLNGHLSVYFGWSVEVWHTWVIIEAVAGS